MANFFYKNVLYLFAGFLILLTIGSFAAPVFAHFGFTSIAHFLYWIYGFFCHQRPWRSIHIFDYQAAWCTRDTFIYFGMIAAAFAVQMKKIKPYSWYFLPIFVIPIALDGGIQLIAEIQAVFNDKLTFFYSSTNFFRAITGSFFGLGVGLWLFGQLKASVEEEISGLKLIKQKFQVFKKRDLRAFKWVGILMLVNLCAYILLVQIWRITSPTYKPYGLFDHMRYFPGVNYEEGVDRRGHGV